MKKAFILVTLILTIASSSQADIWKCQKEGEKAASYTDTPTGEPGVNCEKAETIRFTKTGNQAGRSVVAAKSYSAPSGHVTTKARAKVKSSAPRTAPAQTKRTSSGGKGGNHPTGIK